MGPYWAGLKLTKSKLIFSRFFENCMKK